MQYNKTKTTTNFKTSGHAPADINSTLRKDALINSVREGAILVGKGI
jgi:hypothetical protein